MSANPRTFVIFLFVIVTSAFAEPEPCAVLDRVFVTGASVTAGFGVTTPPVKGDLGAYTVNVKHVIEGMITSKHEDVAYFGDLLFFKNAKANAAGFVEKIKEYEPTLVVGIDFLFWFGHGSAPKDVDVQAYRIEKMQFALELLEQLSVPVIVGNLPDVSSTVEKMLSVNNIPTKETLHILNERIRDWGELNENVTVIDAYALWHKAMQGEEIVLFNHTWPEGSQEKLLQKDMLHTTLEGTVAACLLVAKAAGIDCMETDPKVIMKKAAASARSDANTKK